MFANFGFSILKFMKSPAFVFFLFMATLLLLPGCTKEQGEEFVKNVQKTIESVTGQGGEEEQGKQTGEKIPFRDRAKILEAVNSMANDYYSLTLLDAESGHGKCPLCSKKSDGENGQVENWELVQGQSLGVQVRDTMGHRIQHPYASYNDVKWKPVDGYKHTLCGEFYDFDIYDPGYWSAKGFGEKADEMDWNIYTIPATYDGVENLPGFAYLINETKKFYGGYDVHDCDGTDNCMEGEVSPDDGETESKTAFYKNPWFNNTDTGGEYYSPITFDLELDWTPGFDLKNPKDYYVPSYYSPLEGQLICMYGPWVGDGGHGGRPEIHPSEAIWWRDGENKQEKVKLLNGKTVSQGDGAYYIMLLEDDSNRFDRIDRFIAPVGGKNMSEADPEVWPFDGLIDWQPWAKAPRNAVFRIPFEVEKPKEGKPTPIYFGIQEVPDNNGAYWARNVITGEDKEDSAEKSKLCEENPDYCLAFHDAPPDSNKPNADNKKHGLALDGLLYVEVEELQDNDMDLGVRFAEVCLYEHSLVTEGDDKKYLRGYVEISVHIGTGEDGDEGFEVLRVTTDPTDVLQEGTSSLIPPAWALKRASPLMQENDAPSEIRSLVCHDCIRSTKVGTRSQLVSDVAFYATPSPGEDPDDFAIFSVTLNTHDGRQELEFEAIETSGNNKPILGVAKSVPIIYGNQIELKMKSGRVVNLSLPTLSIAPFISRESPGAGQPHPDGWEAMVAAIGENSPQAGPPSPVMSIQHWEIEISPRYAPLKKGRPSPEDESFLEETIREILIEDDRERMLQVFGSEQPFTVEWSFKAINLVSGNEVPVKIGRDVSQREVSVRLQDGQVPDGVVQVTFPNPTEGATYELTAFARMKDTLDTEWMIQHKLYSHVLSVEPTQRVLDNIAQTVATFAGVSPDELIGAASFDKVRENIWAHEDAFARRARIVRMRSLYAAQDQRITVSELNEILSMAKLAGNR